MSQIKFVKQLSLLLIWYLTSCYVNVDCFPFKKTKSVSVENQKKFKHTTHLYTILHSCVIYLDKYVVILHQQGVVVDLTEELSGHQFVRTVLDEAGDIEVTCNETHRERNQHLRVCAVGNLT